MMQLSVCLLTRNEAEKLPRVLGSVSGLADEVIVADTASTDDTVAVAKKLGARVIDAGWDDDFAKGQNQALAAAQGDWILWLNPDEELDAASHTLMRGCMAQANVLAWVIRVWEFIRRDDSAYTETAQPRLFRNGQSLRYRGRLHADFDPPLTETARKLGLQIGAAPITVRKHAYLSTLTPDKLRWAARLFEKELHDRPGQLQFLIEYGRTLQMLNDPRAAQVLAEAAEQVLRVADAPAAPTAAVGLLLEQVLTTKEAPAGPLSHAQAQDLARRWFPNTPPILWALASAEFHAGRFDAAIPLLERLLQLGATGQYDRSAAFEPGILGGMAWLNLGICYTRLQDWARAELCFGKLMALPGWQEQGRKHYAWVQERKKEPAGGAGT